MSKEAVVVKIIGTVRALLKFYDLENPWPTTQGKLTKRLKRLLEEYDFFDKP